jgi:hypothetical protein
MDKRKRFQHGDVIMIATNKIPEDAKEIEVGKMFVVEKGEGVHTHVIENTEGLKAFVDKNEVMWLKTGTKTKVLDHEEHGPKTFIGDKQKYIENEYDAEADETRKTLD